MLCCCSLKDSDKGEFVIVTKHTPYDFGREELDDSIDGAAMAAGIGAVDIAADDQTTDSGSGITKAVTVNALPKAIEFRCSFTKKQEQVVGMQIDTMSDGLMQVCIIRPGALEDYNQKVNASGSAEKVQVGDFIVEVNGVRGNRASMISRLQQDVDISMLVRRPSPWSVSLPQAENGSFGPCVPRAHALLQLVSKIRCSTLCF